MYFSQWQREKNLCVKSRGRSRMIAKGFGPPRVDCVPTREALELGEAPHSRVFDGQRHMGSSWKNLVSCPAHWAKSTNVICPFFEENSPRSGSTMLWGSVRKYKTCLSWHCALGERPQVFHEPIIQSPYSHSKEPLRSGPCIPRPPSLLPPYHGSLQPWNPGFLLPLQHAKLIPTSEPLSLLSPGPGTHSPPSLQDFLSCSSQPVTADVALPNHTIQSASPVLQALPITFTCFVLMIALVTMSCCLFENMSVCLQWNIHPREVPLSVWFTIVSPAPGTVPGTVISCLMRQIIREQLIRVSVTFWV